MNKNILSLHNHAYQLLGYNTIIPNIKYAYISEYDNVCVEFPKTFMLSHKH